MYQLDWIQRLRVLDKSPAANSARQKPLGVSANVWRLGFTSFFTDISSEMVSSILPLYFISYLRFSPFQFGILDGIYQGAAVALLSLFSGFAADRWRRQKELASAGYGFSALSRLVLLLAGGNWIFAAATLVMDRIGKGIRTAPRDAMISLSSRADNLATAFAVHRGLDAGGAVFGPLAAFLVLRLVPGGFSLVLAASFCIALIGLGLIALLVEKPALSANTRPPALSLSLGLWKHPPFRVLLICGALLSLTTVSDSFLYLSLQRSTNAPSTMFPLFAFVTAVSFLIFSVPMGRLADRWGRKKVFLAGNGLLLFIYAILLSPGLGTRAPFAILGLLGAYYAATDGIMAAMGSAVLKPELRTSGLAILNTAISVFRFFSSFVFGLLWTDGSSRPPIAVFLAGVTVAIIVANWNLTRKETL